MYVNIFCEHLILIFIFFIFQIPYTEHTTKHKCSLLNERDSVACWPEQGAGPSRQEGRHTGLAIAQGMPHSGKLSYGNHEETQRPG